MRLLAACAEPGDAALDRFLSSMSLGVALAIGEDLHRDGLLVDWETTSAGRLALATAAPFSGREVANADGPRQHMAAA